jgi:hypothetical protein
MQKIVRNKIRRMKNMMKRMGSMKKERSRNIISEMRKIDEKFIKRE